MNKRQILTFAVFATILLSFASCKSREEKVISKLESLSERIDKKGHTFDAEDWAEAFEDLEDIHADMEDCEFTREELKKVGRADGRLTAIIAKEGAKALGRETSSFLRNFSSFAKGSQEGAKENFNEEDFNDVEEELKSTLKDIEDEWKE